jgi:hypothetical protein
MSKAQSQTSFGTVIKRLKPLRDGGAGTLQVTIVERDNERRLDVRYFVKTPKYRGPTRKGISLSAEEFDALMAQRKKIVKLLTP